MTIQNKIVVVNDHRGSREALTHLLRRKGYEADAAGTIEAALKIAEQNTLGLIITKTPMPEQERLAAYSRETRVSVIVLSGYEEGYKKNPFKDSSYFLIPMGTLTPLLSRINQCMTSPTQRVDRQDFEKVRRTSSQLETKILCYKKE